MTEWEIHEVLERQLNKAPLMFEGVALHLVASEVMPAVWGINDPQKYWASPSIDFVFLDEKGTLWLAELKNRKDTLNDAWNTFCQVVYAEYLFTQNGVSAGTLALVRQRYVMSRQKSLASEIAVDELPKFSGSIRCMIISTSLRCWHEVSDFAKTHSFGVIKAKLCTSYDITSKRNLHMRRFCELPVPDTIIFPTPIYIPLDRIGISYKHQEAR